MRDVHTEFYVTKALLGDGQFIEGFEDVNTSTRDSLNEGDPFHIMMMVPTMGDVPEHIYYADMVLAVWYERPFLGKKIIKKRFVAHQDYDGKYLWTEMPMDKILQYPPQYDDPKKRPNMNDKWQ